MPVPTKPFGKPGGGLGVMVGGGSKVAAPTAGSDGLKALAARLAGAKKNKAMKPPKARPKAKQDFSKGTGL